MHPSDHIQIVAADKTREGLAVTFSDGTTTLFPPAILYAMRLQPGNLQVFPQQEDEE